jgi:hypothetical protein
MRSHFSNRPPVAAQALGRYLTKVGGFINNELPYFDMIVADDSKRSCRVQASDETHARHRAGQVLGVDPARTMQRPAPYRGVEG